MTVLIAQAPLDVVLETERRVIVEWDKRDGYSVRIQYRNLDPKLGLAYWDSQAFTYGRTKDALRKCLRKFTRVILDTHDE